MFREPTVENLKTLYESEIYQNLLHEFVERSNRELDNREQEAFDLFHKLVYCQRRYHILGISFEEVLSAFEKHSDIFLEYQLAATALFDGEDNNSTAEKSDLTVVSVLDKTYLLERFCEFYLLQTGNKERLWYYLTVTRKLQSYRNKRYTEQITRLYHQTVVENI